MIYIPDEIFFDFTAMESKYSDSESDSDFEKIPKGKKCLVYAGMEGMVFVRDKEFWEKESKKSLKELREEYGDIEVWFDFYNVIINLKDYIHDCSKQRTFNNFIKRNCYIETFNEITEHFYKDVDPKYIEILLKYMETYEEKEI